MSELVRLAKEALKQQRGLNPVQPATAPTIAVGSTITWTRADLTTPTGVIDYLHVDSDGMRWAFVTLGESWAAVNTKFAQVATGEGHVNLYGSSS